QEFLLLADQTARDLHLLEGFRIHEYAVIAVTVEELHAFAVHGQILEALLGMEPALPLPPGACILQGGFHHAAGLPAAGLEFGMKHTEHLTLKPHRHPGPEFGSADHESPPHDTRILAQARCPNSEHTNSPSGRSQRPGI